MFSLGRYFCLFSLCFIFCGRIVFAAQGREFSLQECFNLALERSTSVGISADQVAQAEAKIQQAKSAYLPTLSLQANTTQQAESTNSLAKNLSATHQSSSNLNLSQNLFQGFKDVESLRQRRNIRVSAEWARKQAVQQLYKDVADSYFSILSYRSDILQYREQIVSTTERKEELKAAKRSGRARDSDILTIESLIANLEATIARSEGLAAGFQEKFTYLTGLPSDVSLVNDMSIPSSLTSVETWLARSEQRPDIQQAKSTVVASSYGIKVARSGYYPTLGLSANYYLSRPTGIFQGVNWDTSLSLSFPFFSGGVTRAEVNEASSIFHSNELLLQQTQELARQSIRTLFRVVQSDLEQFAGFQKSSRLSQQSYRLVHRDNQLGTATNSDVLSALQQWQESKRSLERARITTLYDYSQLRVESSQLTLYE